MPSSQDTVSSVKEYVLISFVACLVIMFLSRHDHKGHMRKQRIPLLVMPILFIKWLWDPLRQQHPDTLHHHPQGHHTHRSLNRQDAFSSSAFKTDANNI
ncbi:hypothetical protein ACHAXH_006093 [Discostella pseudostelligera]